MVRVIGFNYNAIDAGKRTSVRQHAVAIHQCQARMAADVVAIGRHLIAVKAQLPQGQWNAWLKAEFGWVHSTASNMIAVAERFGSLDCLSQFQPSALYEFTRERVPDPAREAAIDLARNGEFITKQRALEIVAQHAPPAAVPQPRPDSVHQLRHSIRAIARNWPADQREQLRAKLAELVEEVLGELSATE